MLNCLCKNVQYEVSMDAYERLMKTTDAKGRKLQVYKLPRPPPLFRTFKEANGLAVRLLDCQLMLRLESSGFNFRTCNRKASCNVASEERSSSGSRMQPFNFST